MEKRNERMVGITEQEQNKGKRMKRTEDRLRDPWGILNTPKFDYADPRRREKESI